MRPALHQTRGYEREGTDPVRPPAVLLRRVEFGELVMQSRRRRAPPVVDVTPRHRAYLLDLCRSEQIDYGGVPDRVAGAFDGGFRLAHQIAGAHRDRVVHDV